MITSALTAANKFPDQEYTTSVQSGYSAMAEKTAKELYRYYLLNSDGCIFKIFKDNIGNEVIILIGNLETVKTFFHPIIYDGKAFVDGRAFVTKNIELKNNYDTIFMVRRAAFDLQWCYNREIFSGVSAFVIATFSTWFDNGLQKKTGISLISATYYKVIAAIYYYSFFNLYSYKENDEDIENLILMKLPRIINIPAQTVNDVFTNYKESILNLCKIIIRKEPSLVKLATVLSEVTNEETIITKSIIHDSLCTGAFISMNSVEITAIAIEFPATFVGILSSVIISGAQSNTSIGRVVTNIKRQHDTDSFMKFIALNSPTG